MSPRASSRFAPGFTLVELLIVIAIIGVVGAMAVPPLMNARRSSMEAAAVASLRALSSAQLTYATTCADGSYATALPQLGRPPASGGPPFMSPDLTVADTVIKAGYAFRLARGTDGDPGAEPACNGVDAPDLSTSYFATAVPVNTGFVGARHYWLGVPGTIFVDRAAIIETNGWSTAPGGEPAESQGPGAAPPGRLPSRASGSGASAPPRPE